MVFAPSPAKPGLVYALVEAEQSALLRSDDGGVNWRAVNEDHNIADRPFYYTELYADPKNAERVYNISTRLRSSIDGGKTFEFNPVVDCCRASNTIHIDNHAFWINPANPLHMIIGNDGGLGITHDRGETWRFVRNLPLAQFYHVAVDDDHPYNVYGGLQDNGSWRGPAEVWENGGIRNLHWQEVGFGDGFDTIPDPEDSMRGYSMSQGGNLNRWNLRTGELRTIRPAPPAEDVELRFNWNAGFALDPFDSATLYYGSQFLHKSSDRGASWEVISGDLTSNDPEKQTFRESGGLTPDVTAAENYTSIVAVAPSPIQPGLLWVGTDDGRVHVTRDDGNNWARIDERARGVAAGSWVPMIHPSPHEPGVAHVVFDDHRRSNMSTYVFRVEDYGRRWKSLSDSTLAGYALSVLQDAEDPSLLFLGTEFGLFFSTDAGESWTKFTAGLPTVSVMDMAIQRRESDLVLGTHGRSIYILDDISALRGLSPSDFEQRLKILSVTNGQQYDPTQTPSTRFTGSGEFRAENEAYGVVLTFVASGTDLPHPDPETDRQRRIDRRDRASETEDDSTEVNADDAPKIDVTVATKDGDVIRRWRTPLQQGINRVVWGLERDGVRPMPGPEPSDLKDGLPGGPEVTPGHYVITLAFDGRELSADAEVLADPRTPYSSEEQQQRYLAEVELLELEDAVVSAVERIVAARDDVETIGELIEKRGIPDGPLGTLAEAGEEINRSLNELEARFRTPPKTKGIVFDDDKVTSQLGMAQYYVGASFGAPSKTAMLYAERARRAVDHGLAELNGFIEGELATYRAAVEEAGIGLLRDAQPVSLD
jgi:photosystem II stability/assembly factor-like uncharacterized protein